MGYYTQYTLSWNKNAGPSYDELEKLTDENWYVARSGALYTQEPTKWYDWENDMLLLSLRYPETLFKLDGEGEESGDIWRAFYKGGKQIRLWKPNITPPAEP